MSRMWLSVGMRLMPKVAPGPHPLANAGFEQRPARGQEHKFALVLNAPAVGVVPAELAANIDGHRSRCTEILGQARKQALQYCSAANQQPMRMGGLRNAFARCGGPREDIPLDQRYLLEVVGENTRGKQAGDAATDNHGLAKGAARHGVAPLCKLLITDQPLRHRAELDGLSIRFEFSACARSGHVLS